MNIALQIVLKFDWENFLLGEQDWSFLFMVGIRTFIMFIVILVGLKMLGKRGVSQLSVFELGVIVGLGSAAGDPMFYKEVGVLSCILVIAVVVLLYHLLKYLTGKIDRLDEWVEGDPIDLICEGELLIKRVNKEPLTKEELFSQLRSNNISHLGQIKQAILESTGQISIFYFKDNEVKPGLPILPQLCKKPFTRISEADCYSCTHCSHTLLIEPTEKEECPVCNHCCWVKALDEKRIS